MSEPLYLDTNVYMDYFQGRKGSTVAKGIFKRTLDCEFNLIVSNWVLTELNKHVPAKETTEFFDNLKKKNKIIEVYATLEDIEDAKNISPEHYHDALHAILAKKAGAKRLVTRNLQDYYTLKSIIEAVLPENI